MEKKREMPDFQNEEEEAGWWVANQERIAQDFGRAAAEGSLNRGTLVKSGITPTTTIRLDPSDIERAKTQAERRGLKYQTYLKMLIHEALQSEEQKAG